MLWITQLYYGSGQFLLRLPAYVPLGKGGGGGSELKSYSAVLHTCVYWK